MIAEVLTLVSIVGIIVGICAAIVGLFLSLGSIIERLIIGKAIRAWAADRGLKVVRLWIPGPFEGTPPILGPFPESGFVCRARMRELKSGRLRSGWIGLPMPFQKNARPDPDQILVRWDDEPKAGPLEASAFPMTFAGVGLAYLVGSVGFVVTMMTVGRALLPDEVAVTIVVFGIVPIAAMGIFLIGTLLHRMISRTLRGPDGPTKSLVPSLDLWDREFDPPVSDKY